MVSEAPRPIAAQQVTVPSRPLGPLLDWFSLKQGVGRGGTHPARVALQELDLLKELDVVRTQAVQLRLQGLDGAGLGGSPWGQPGG